MMLGGVREMGAPEFIPEVVGPPASEIEDCYVLPVRDFAPLFVIGQGAARVPRLKDAGDLPRISEFHHVGNLNGEPLIAWEVPLDAEPPAGMEFVNLRALYSLVSEVIWKVAGRAVQIVDWDRTNRFCGRCGKPTQLQNGDRARVCPDCGWRAYPRLSPAVIMLIHDGDRLLLGRSHRFRNAYYSVLAGFVEPGESLEGAVRREVREEVGLEIDDIRYFSSQPWPFPNSLMIGFTARYAGGEIRLQDEEIAAADWFTVDDLPQLPGKISIARKLIDWFIECQTGAAPD